MAERFRWIWMQPPRCFERSCRRFLRLTTDPYDSVFIWPAAMEGPPEAFHGVVVRARAPGGRIPFLLSLTRRSNSNRSNRQGPLSSTSCHYFAAAYNSGMADRIVCACVICPGCGSWVVVEGEISRSNNPEDKLTTTCPLPECSKAFVFTTDETRAFDVPTSLFERRHFYRSEL